MSGRKILICAAAIFCLGLTAGLAVSFSRGISRPMSSDAFYYLSIAKSLAAGEGYALRQGFWPDRPTMSRSPGWPFAVAVVLRVFGPANPDIAMRLMSLALHAAAAAMVFALAAKVTGNMAAAFCAGAMMAMHPAGLHLADEGASEPLFIVLCLAGALSMFGGWKRAPAAAGLLGAATLVRPNLILFAALWPIALIAKYWPAADRGPDSESWKRAAGPVLAVAAGIVLFLIPSTLWAVRNWRVCGSFPVLSTLQGQTFYGGNNALTARPGEYWGYWVFPDAIPGERSMRELAAEMDEQAVSEYYMRRGLEYLRSNAGQWPALIAGKLLRAYAPVPWKPTAASVAASIFRWIFYGLAARGIIEIWRNTSLAYRTMFLAFAASNVISVAVFWGCARFAFPLDPFLAPFAGAAVAAIWNRAWLHGHWAM